ncbi:hypothetical protein ACFVYF_06660 [Streptomyces sp. NPDC058274]|jgi:hypothetical protein|uniref:hypothetical protein n=1 Tax=Streptomyces sp. NPDC058274 TaxID=3346416 RepID=UPI0036E97FD4
MRVRGGWCAVVASVFLVAACSSGGGGEKATGSSPSAPPDGSRTAPSVSATAPTLSEEQLVQQAQAALDAVHTGRMVEAGAERVTDGIHTEPGLSEGKSYQLSLVCFGSGSARLAFTPARGGTRTTVPCDQSLVRQRITGRRTLRIDVDGTKGSTGVIAWRVDAL